MTRRRRLVVAMAVIVAVAAGTVVGVLAGRGGDGPEGRASRPTRPGPSATAATSTPSSTTSTTLPSPTTTGVAALRPGPGAPVPGPASPVPTSPPAAPPTGPFPITPGVPTNGLLLTEVTCRADGDELVATGRLHNLSYPAGLIDLEVSFLDATGAELDWDTDLFTLDPGASETFELSGLADTDTVPGLRCAFTAG